MYYAPWRNLAIFYHASGHAARLVKLGALDGVDHFRRRSTLPVTLDLDED